MPQIIPIRDLKDTAAISEKCRLSDAPIFITKNGYGDMVIMSIKRYEESLARLDVYAKLADAEQQVSNGLD
jgi:PHD/YefM family antitoxin component YafN of YafNO toxin-antitoxin module